MSSYLQTPFTAPKHRRGMRWEKNILDSCRRARDVDRARKDFTLNLVRQLTEENKPLRPRSVSDSRSRLFADMFKIGLMV